MFPTSTFKGARRFDFKPSRRRRRGIAVVYIGALMVFLLMIASMTIDMGFLYRKSGQAQSAADAAALAGAWQMANGQGVVKADSQARVYAALPANGSYVYGVDGADVKTEYPAKDENGVVQNNWYRVTVSRPERTFFALALSSRSKYVVSATAVALYSIKAKMDIRGVGAYGSSGGKVNLSLFGPSGSYSGGDLYSTTLLDNGQPNPDNKNWKGYDFFVNVPSNVTNPQIDVYDPDCYNKDKIASVGNGRVDEIRLPNQSLSGFYADGTSPYSTVTQYTVYDDNGTPDNTADDIQLSQVKYGGAATDVGDVKAGVPVDNTWVSLIKNTNRIPADHNYRVNVLALSGSSENGYDLRAGPTLASNQSYNPDNGSTISANGAMCLNFNDSTTSQISLGQIPLGVAGGNASVTHFDTDVGSTSLNYTCSTLPTFNSPGNLGPADQRNGMSYRDTFGVPTNYTKIGTWYASYAAGANDTSTWKLEYSKSVPGSPGSIKLVR